MRKYILKEALALRLSERQRIAIEELADTREISLAEACRQLNDAGLESMTISRSSGRVL
jgi:hypothetical protein